MLKFGYKMIFFLYIFQVNPKSVGTVIDFYATANFQKKCDNAKKNRSGQRWIKEQHVSLFCIAIVCGSALVDA